METDDDAWDDFLYQVFVRFSEDTIMNIDTIRCIYMQVCRYIWMCMHMYIYVCLLQNRRKEEDTIFLNQHHREDY